MKSVRLIQSGYCDAITNMATDEAIFLSYKENYSIPTLRIYGWEPSAISMGYSQIAADVLDLETCNKEKISIVRRPTGGGIIFHDKELTYSLILAQKDIGVEFNVKKSFEKITSFLLLAYKNLGVTACFAKDLAEEHHPKHSIATFCFSRNEDYDILICGKKIGGNAQKRRRNIILQHGSIPISFNREKAASFLKNPAIAKNINATCIEEIVNKNMGFHALSDIVLQSFSCHFKSTLKERQLSDEEKLLIEKLKIKYSDEKQGVYED